MIGTVALIDTTAYGAGTRGVARVNRDDRHACEGGFVLDKLAKLVERPVRVSCPLLAPNRYPVTDTLEVFEGDPAPGVLRGLHDTLADAVVGVCLVALLLAGYLAELALGRPRPLALEVAAAVLVLAALVFNLLAAVLLAVAVCREVDDAEVDAEESANVFWRWRLDFAGDEQVELAADVAQVGLAPVALQQLALALTTQVRHALATLKRPDTHHLLVGAEAEDAVIVGERAARLEGAPGSFVELVGVGHLADSPHRHLGGQAVAFAHGVVGEVVQRVLLKRLARPRLLADVVAGGVGCLQSLEQHSVLFGRGLQLDLSREFHIGSITYPTERCKPAACPSFLSPLKGGVSRRRF